jgi:hypothetical protein
MMAEIYNEQVFDLLAAEAASNKNKLQSKLRVREDPEKGVYVQELTSADVRHYAEVEALLAQGSGNRKMAAHGLNDFSSRSHTIFTMLLISFLKAVSALS